MYDDSASADKTPNEHEESVTGGEGAPEVPSADETAVLLPADVAAIAESLTDEGDQGAEETEGDKPVDPWARADWTMAETSILPAVPSSDDEAKNEPEQQPDSIESDPWFAVPARDLDETAAEETPQDPSAPVAIPGIDMGPSRRSGVWKWVLLVAAILAVAVGGVYAYWYYTARPVAVPALTGKLPAQAVQALNDAGLKLGKVSDVATESAPVGTVITQIPPAGKTLTVGQTVNLVLASAPAVARVPSVEGKTEAAAQSTLAMERLTGFSVPVYDANSAAGNVVAQIPLADMQLPPGSSVVLIVSKGAPPTSVRMPNLVGLRDADARLLADSTNRRVSVFQSFDASIPAGIVLAQAPTPESALAYDGAIQYLVSLGVGTGNVLVPNEIGAKSADAEKALKKLGVKVKITKVTNGSAAPGVVIAQMPPAGRRTLKGAAVGLMVSRGATATGTVPDLVGRSSIEATTAINSAGFVPKIVELSSADHPAGQVFAQFPQAGTSWGFRLPVVMVVAKD